LGENRRGCVESASVGEEGRVAEGYGGRWMGKGVESV
jgi:hypothetical protein